MKQRLILSILSALTLSLPALAATDTDTPAVSSEMQASYTAQIIDLNKIKPYQNTRFIKGSALLDKKLLDGNNQSMGTVSEAIISIDSTIENISVDLDSAGFRQEVTLPLEEYQISLKDGVIQTPVTDKQMTASLDRLMAQTAPAAGDQDETPVRLSKVMKADIVRKDGTRIGKVENVMIDDKRKAVAALVVALLGGGNRGTYIAIPYDQKSVKAKSGGGAIEVSDEQAQVIATFAKK